MIDFGASSHFYFAMSSPILFTKVEIYLQYAYKIIKHVCKYDLVVPLHINIIYGTIEFSCFWLPSSCNETKVEIMLSNALLVKIHHKRQITRH